MSNRINLVEIKHTILTHADLVAERHASYVSQFVTLGNEELYAILADILKLHEQLEGINQRDKLIESMRQHLREVYGIKTVNRSSGQSF